MVNVFKELGCYDNQFLTSYSLEGPTVTASQLKNYLYSKNFDNELLYKFER